MQLSEGGLEIEVDQPRDGTREGSGDGVFFNPTMELNRDITVAALRAYQEREPRVDTYLDAMAASGIRGVRAANEGYSVTCCDLDSEAAELAGENLARNDLNGEVENRNVNALLHESMFDVVDLDPFGTPIPFADAAFATTRNMVCVTATDTAPLCGAHRNSGIRKYSTVPQNTDYHPEMGLRTLLSALVRTAARYDVAATPICSHVSRHYARTYLELDHRATSADSLLENLGFIHHCEDCLARRHEFGHFPESVPEECPVCGSSRTLTAGPVWLGPVADSEFTESVIDHLTPELDAAARAERLLSTVAEEIDTPTHYDQHRLCKQWGVPANAMDEFVDDLQAAGYSASKAHYSGTAFKTTATVGEIREAAAPDADS
ncbi:tRNA (guanine(26)-N(2))-dimethyltransferase [Halohasta litorea]|uniref:tRNA (guanine(26)-N(2))-dimethyltransferase n=1 Tax=Halohasta litorea TaxID=869891 RepID=A0ABD6D969_9EURY|nr:tRNA (guanine(26)-N(2))-dimethyltransferase [Halohasta litorea]